MKLITIAIPCFNEEENVENAYKKLKSVLKNCKYSYEYIFVDNGSSDNTREKIQEIINKDKSVKGVYLSRNFGPEASAKAAFDYSSGDAIISFASDLQDPPELLPKLLKKWEEGYDIILGQYDKLDDSKFMTFMRKTFYKLFKVISNIDVPINVTGFGLYDRKVVDALKCLPEKMRFGRGLVAWVGFKTVRISYERKKRLKGKSSYSFVDYIKHSERGIFGFSYLPLDILVYAGFILTVLSFGFIVGYLLMVIFFGNPINASIPLMLAIVFFGGLNLLGLSIIGKYVQVIVEETKNRPVYIVDKKINFNK